MQVIHRSQPASLGTPSALVSRSGPGAAVLASLALATALVGGGCTLWPSSWRLGGSPLARQARAASALTTAQGAAVQQAQAAVHQAATALAAAPAENRPVRVARDFVGEAAALLDQARGAPTAAETAQWSAFVGALLSDNATVRAEAERDRAARASETARLSERLAAATATATRANAAALRYATERESLADFAGKLKLGCFALLGLAGLGTVLSVAARFFPGTAALGVASKLINGVVAPGITFAAHRAETGLSRIGQGMTRLRELAGAGAESLIERAFDAHTDADHQALIATGAARAAINPPAPLPSAPLPTVSTSP